MTADMFKELIPNMRRRIILIEKRRVLLNETDSVPHVTGNPGPLAIPAAIPTGNPAVVNANGPALQPWPLVFQLPTLPPAIEQHLKQEDAIFLRKEKSGLRTKLISYLVDLMMRYTLYPSSRQYRQVVESLVGRHPFLRGVNGNGEDTLIASLCNKYRKDRQPLTHLDAVKAAKRKFGRVGGGRKPLVSDEDLEVTPKKGPRPSGEMEDTNSLSSGDAQSLLSIEANRLNPDMDKVTNVISEHKDIIALNLSTKTTGEILRTYPWIKHPRFLTATMNIVNDLTIERNTCRNLTKYWRRILEEGKKKDSNSDVLHQLEEHLSKETSAESRASMKINAAVMMLPSLFHESKEILMVQDKDPERPHPVIVFEGSVFKPRRACIKMDSLEVTEDTEDLDVLKGLSCLMALYYLFDIQYPMKCSTLKFIQFYICDIPRKSNEKVPTSVKRVQMMLSS